MLETMSPEERHAMEAEAYARPEEVEARTVACPLCGARPGVACRNRYEPRCATVHTARLDRKQQGW